MKASAVASQLPGIFFATQMASRDLIDEETHDELGTPYDAAVLEAGGGFTVLLRRIAGPQTAMAAVVFGQVLDGPEAERVGLAYRSVPADSLLEAANFSDVRITPRDESREFIRDWVPGSGVEDYVISAHIEAVKPASGD